MRRGAVGERSSGCKRVLRHVVVASLVQTAACFSLSPMTSSRNIALRKPPAWCRHNQMRLPLAAQPRTPMMSSFAPFGGGSVKPAEAAADTLSKNFDEITEVVSKKFPYIPKQLVNDMVSRGSTLLKEESPAVVEKLLAGTMAKSARDEIRDNYAKSLNERIDLPILDERQEEELFKRTVDVMFDFLELRSNVSEGMKSAAKALDLTERTLTFMDKVEALMTQVSVELNKSGSLLSSVSIFLGKVCVFLLLCKLHWKLAFLFLIAANFVGTQALFVGAFSLIVAGLKFLFSDNPIIGVGLVVVWGLHDFGIINVPAWAAVVSGHVQANFLKVVDVNGDGIFSFADIVALFRA